MAKLPKMKGLSRDDSTIEHKDQAATVSGKMILSSNVPIQDQGALLKAAADVSKDKIQIREDLEIDVKTAVTNEGSADDNLVQVYKESVAVIEKEIPLDYTAQGDLGVKFGDPDVKATICLSPANCHGSHGDPAHSMDGICNTDPNRKSLRFLVTKGAPDDDSSYIEPEVIKATPKHVLALLPETHRNVPLWGKLVPFNTFGKGNSSTPFKIEPLA